MIYPEESFRQLLEVNLVAPVYWGLEMIARVAEQRKRRGLGRWDRGEGVQGMVIFLGAASQGSAGQIGYATAKAGLEGVEATLAREAIDHGVRSPWSIPTSRTRPWSARWATSSSSGTSSPTSSRRV